MKKNLLGAIVLSVHTTSRSIQEQSFVCISFLCQPSTWIYLETEYGSKFKELKLASVRKHVADKKPLWKFKSAEHFMIDLVFFFFSD